MNRGYVRPQAATTQPPAPVDPGRAPREDALSAQVTADPATGCRDGEPEPRDSLPARGRGATRRVPAAKRGVSRGAAPGHSGEAPWRDGAPET